MAKAQTTKAKVGRPHIPTLYGIRPDGKFLPWRHAARRLTKSRNYWICTARPDGRPHAMPVWGLWRDGALYFSTARASRKGRNLAYKPSVSVHLESGDDAVMLEGEVVEINDPALLKKLNASYRAKYKMPLWLAPENVVYCVRPKIVLAWTEKDYLSNATRWEFGKDVVGTGL